MTQSPEHKLDFGAQSAWLEVDLTVTTSAQSFINLSATESCDVSFDGINVHISLAPNQTFTYERHPSIVLWIRNTAQAVNAGHEVQIVAWREY